MHFLADGYSVLRHSPNGASMTPCPHTREDNDVLLSTLKHITATNQKNLPFLCILLDQVYFCLHSTH